MIHTELNGLVKAFGGHAPALKPSSVWNAELEEQIAKAPLYTFGYEGGGQKTYTLAVKAGLHLWNESLDASHTLSQDIHNPTGGYWHGIMHRMEGDYGNAKYWFRQVGRHEAFEELLPRAVRFWEDDRASLSGASAKATERLLTSSAWDPYLFIDLVEEQVRYGRGEANERLLRRIQREELAALLAYSYKMSSGGSRLELV